MFGVKVTGPSSDPWSGWAIRKGLDANLSVKVLVAKSLSDAEKFHTLEEAEEVGFLLATQQPGLLGRIRIAKLRQSELDRRWMVDSEA